MRDHKRSTRRTGPSRPARLAAVLACGLSIAGAGMPRAGELATPGCLDGGAPHRIIDVDAELELILEDGRHLLLAGLDLPREGEWPHAGRTMLAGWLDGRTVLVRDLAAEPDRWNRMPALVFADGASGRVSVAEAMIEAGLARARPDPGVAPCWPIDLDLEARARSARRGLWGDPRFTVIAADDSARLAAAVGRRVVVESRVVDEAEGRGRIYLHLTAEGRRGLTITVDRRLAARLKAAGRDLAAWRGRPVRIRGLLDDRFGLEIELTSADQIEFTGSL